MTRFLKICRAGNTRCRSAAPIVAARLHSTKPPAVRIHMRSVRELVPVLWVAILTGFLVPAARAADQTWQSTGFADGNWNVGGNWIGGAAPGASTGATNGDTATFNGGANLSVTIDAGRNVKSILFDTASAGAFNFSGGPLTITNAGSITLNSTVASNGNLQ
jgi:hypothetical protein